MGSFKIASKFRKVAEVVNMCIPNEKLPLLLNRVIQKLHLRNVRLFSEEEEEQLKSIFSLSSEDLSLVLDGCCYIFEQSAYAGVAPEPLFDTLLEAGFNESSAKVIGRFWASEAAAFIAKLKSRTLGSKALIDSSYHLNLIMSDSRLKTQHEPTAVFELNVSDGNVNDDEAINVEFNHSELYSFFSQLEHIQQQLDQLS